MSLLNRAVRRAVLGAIRGYQLARLGHLSPCRFTPSCSEYAIEAITNHGTIRGTALAIRRVARCNPLGGRGFDPVPG